MMKETMHERHKQFAIHKRQNAELYWKRADKLFGIIKMPFWIAIKCISFTLRILFLMPIILLQKIICGFVTCFIFWRQLPVRKMFREIFCHPITEAIEESLIFNFKR